MKNLKIDSNRPYLIIPKLVEQPTWGGSYIVESKGWSTRRGHDVKIGQSYELFSGSNLSLLSSSTDPSFVGELTDRDAVQVQTNPDNSIRLADLVSLDPVGILGQSVVDERGPVLALLIKFTQALGNSFQVHIKDGVKNSTWKPKPESWYYFEPGLLTFGVKADADWALYEKSLRKVHALMINLSNQVQTGSLSYNDAQIQISNILAEYNPWQFVNTVEVLKDQIVDLSKGGIHHSWEEDPDRAPLGNVLLELQGEAMDDVSTFRSFDKGKMASNGTLRDIHLDTYFEVIDRSQETNDPTIHVRYGNIISENTDYRLEELMRSQHYNLDKLTLLKQHSTYQENTDRYKHLFVKTGSIVVSAGLVNLTVTTGHSCFIPAIVNQYKIENISDNSEILISY